MLCTLGLIKGRVRKLGVSKKNARIPKFHTRKFFSYHIKVMKFNERNEMNFFFHLRNEIYIYFYEKKLKINENLCIKECHRLTRGKK